jgi:hypothetical protein
LKVGIPDGKERCCFGQFDDVWKKLKYKEID